ncbi:putative glycoside hydrolase [Photobacterium rosenbergii]|uniref:Glycoside hydrolase n=1 Tax=Photobacterium rosenbergii TaxID=294936 RepID=A0ABU3ZHD3_9GAMM|nr:putative glycoside hydrolase [Photobacterium rosenbergii]MDV5169535.1 putative glycoside hydrolase [Photobacterium rosenbergii]
MTYKKSSLALLIVSAFALTGCLSDNYDYSGDGNTGGGGGGGGGGNGGSGGASNELGLQVPLYHNDPKDYESPYVMYAVDADGSETAVDGNPLPASSNINVEGEFANVDPLTVTVSEDKASLIFSADKAYDINKANIFNAEKNLGGSIQFYVNTLSYDLGDDPENPNPVLLTMFNGDTKVSTDITSSVIASASGKAQFIRVPLNCFIDEGLDLTNVDIAMAIETQGAIQYEFSQARLANNSVSLTPASANIQGCYNNNNSKVLTEEEAIILRDTKLSEATGDWELSGEAQDIRITRGSSITIANNGTNVGATGDIRARGIYYDDKFDPEKRSILSFAIDIGANLKDMAQPRLDLSHYMLNGELQAEFVIPNNATVNIPTEGELELVMQFYSPGNNTTDLPSGGYGNSVAVTYNLTAAEADKGKTLDIAIPLRDFFTSANGQVSLNALQYVEKLETHVQVNDGDGNIDFSQLTGFRYGLGDIKLVMNPDASAPDAQ